jgi:uncharacterized protein (DUF1810 family)
MANQIERFVQAQEPVFQQALDEVRQGRKRSHWMWFVFPQLRGLGRSAMSVRYGIEDLQEAKDYLTHPVLSARLEQITRAVQESGAEPGDLFGAVDYQKYVSCMTLFALAAGPGSLFAGELERLEAFDRTTQQMMEAANRRRSDTSAQ